MVVSEKEALWHIQHEEQLFELKEISESTFRSHVQDFLNTLRSFNSSKADDELSRLNRKYGRMFS